MNDTKKIWIDMDNSPHVPFFKPIIEELNNQGYQVMLTARDCSQVCGLADLMHLHYHRIGRHYGKHKSMKMFGLFMRALQLAPKVLKQKPDLAVSHGSRSQMLLASLLRIPWIIIVDYEHIQLLPFTRATKMIVPEVLSHNSLSKYTKTIGKYSGIKEDVYIPYFKPDARILKDLGMTNGELLVTLRPPATEAHYFNPESADFFKEVVDYLGNIPKLRIVMLPRYASQDSLIRKMWPQWLTDRKVIIPDQVVDGLNLIWHSDFVVSGGGTMNRESAALGVPVYSIFRGKIGAVDRYLAESGRLTILKNIDEAQSKIIIERRQKPIKYENTRNVTMKQVINEITSVV